MSVAHLSVPRPKIVCQLVELSLQLAKLAIGYLLLH